MFASPLINWFKITWTRQEGQAMAEYGIILALIAAVVIGVLATLGTDILNAFTTITGKL